MADIFDTYKAADLDEGGGYFGFLSPSGAWYIQKTTATAIRYAKGTSGYATAWTNRATLSPDYDYINAVFGT